MSSRSLPASAARVTAAAGLIGGQPGTGAGGTRGRVEYDWQRRRMYLFGRRLHHGLTGAVFVAVGLGLMWHDRADRWWRASAE
jgi:hypothetical protein